MKGGDLDEWCSALIPELSWYPTMKWHCFGIQQALRIHTVAAEITTKEAQKSLRM